MVQRSFYDILEVERSATFDEIKLAFKKRALQVHPDKGGSKEAFHLVYEALETLADPEARTKYDRGLAAGKARNITKKEQSEAGSEKASKKHRNFRPSGQKPEHEPPPSRKKRNAEQGHATAQPPETSRSKQTKLLIKIRDILKTLPRDVRNDVFTQQFSQKQRLLLEKFMVDSSSVSETTPEAQLVAAACVSTNGRTAGREAVDVVATVANTSQDPATLRDARTSAVLALPAASPSSTTEALRTKAGKPLVKRRVRGLKQEPKKRLKSTCGTVYQDRSAGGCACYRARIWFDALDIYTKRCDLQTALEFLLILTSMKQKFLDCMNTSASFEECLSQALTSSAQEQGREAADLNLRFSVAVAAGFLIAPRFVVRSPAVSSIECLGRVRKILEPFRQYGARLGFKRSLFWLYDPTHLQTAWDDFQNAIAVAWEAAGADRAPFLQKIRTLNKTSAPLRAWDLQVWEGHHMAVHDKNKHRPVRLRDVKTNRRECKERKWMAIHDKTEHQVKDVRERCRDRAQLRWERSQMAINDRNKHRPRRLRVHSDKSSPHGLTARLSSLKMLLVRWGKMLESEARRVDQQRRRIMRERKKTQKDQKRADFLNRKRKREEQQMRRDYLRKRMKSDLTMDEILCSRHAERPEKKKTTSIMSLTGLHWNWIEMFFWHSPLISIIKRFAVEFRFVKTSHNRHAFKRLR